MFQACRVVYDRNCFITKFQRAPIAGLRLELQRISPWICPVRGLYKMSNDVLIKLEYLLPNSLNECSSKS